MASINLPAEFVDAICDDLNTHQALAIISQTAKNGNLNDVYLMLEILGLDVWRFGKLESDIDHEALEVTENFDRQTVVRLVENRLLARHNKDWKESDRLRDELAAMGIQIKDNKDGTTTWEVKR